VREGGAEIASWNALTSACASPHTSKQRVIWTAARSLPPSFGPRVEVPPSVITVIRAAASERAPARGRHATQGYEGEFGNLGALVRTDMPSDLALDYRLRILRAWSGPGDNGLPVATR